MKKNVPTLSSENYRKDLCLAIMSNGQIKDNCHLRVQQNHHLWKINRKLRNSIVLVADCLNLIFWYKKKQVTVRNICIYLFAPSSDHIWSTDAVIILLVNTWMQSDRCAACYKDANLTFVWFPFQSSLDMGRFQTSSEAVLELSCHRLFSVLCNAFATRLPLLTLT